MGYSDRAMLDRFHIAVATPQPPTRIVIEHVARTVDLTSYDSRLRLRSVLPRSVAFRSAAEHALAVARRIQCPDLIRIVYREADLPPRSPFAAFRMGRTADGFIFEDRHEERISIGRSDIHLVVLGQKTSTSIESGIEYSDQYFEDGREYSRSHMMVNQVRRRRKRRATFISFFRRNPNAAPIRILTDVFDFRCLGRHRGHSDHDNSRKLLDMIDAAIVGLPADRRLMDTSIGPTTIPHNPRTSPDVEHAAAYLVYWEFLARQHPDGLFDATGLSFDAPE